VLGFRGCSCKIAVVMLKLSSRNRTTEEQARPRKEPWSPWGQQRKCKISPPWAQMEDELV